MSRRRLLLGWRDAWKENETELEAASQATERERRQDQSQLEQARLARGRGEFSQAVELYRPLVKSRPRESFLRRELGLCLYEMGQHIQARVEFERLARAPKGDNLASLFLGLCLLHLNRPDKAVQAWRRFVPESDGQRPMAQLLAEQCARLEAEGAPVAPTLETVSKAAVAFLEE